MEDYRKQILIAIAIVWSALILFMVEQGHYYEALGLAALGGLVALPLYPGSQVKNRNHRKDRFL